MKKTVVMLIAAGYSVLVGADGYYIKQKNTISGQTTEITQFILNDQVRSEDSANIMIFNGRDVTTYDKNSKTFFQQTLDQLAETGKMVDAQFTDFVIKKTGKKSKVGQWDADIYSATFQLMGMDTEADIYITKHGQYPSDLIFTLPAKLYPQAKNFQNMLAQLKTAGGIQVKSVAKIKSMGVVASEIVSEVEELKKIDLDKEIFKGPEGYKQVDPPKN